MLQSNRQTNLPKDAVVFFPDGNMLCAVNGDFENLQESPAGFGQTIVDSLLSLRKDLLNERDEIDRRLAEAGNLIDSMYKSQGMSDFDIAMKRNSRIIETWPAWKRNGGFLDGKGTNATPRTPVDNNGDDGGF